ncbi:unnamed protein product [Clonostachys rosea f. rosea IK726]|uniref:Uncharacterized protein n=2 Tax=Bionectria ochroleuca TaxID=29856 RepID=A0A0B7KKP9_BIOOC|nr:unnamed protein product [Clonostachys rosea f. rosea IK726]
MSDDIKKFEEVFYGLAEDLRHQCIENEKVPGQVWNWFEKSLNYNVTGGKYNRGLSVVHTTRFLLGRDLDSDEYLHAATLGWLVELLQAMMLVLDDIMDSAATRRGRPCWYLMPDVGMIAVNDAPMLESAIYLLLKKHFRQHPAYVDMIELLQNVSFQVELGQTYDMLVATQDLESFNLETYNGIATHKTSYYSFYLPVALALLYTGRSSARNLDQARNILLSMGRYFQVQDDYLDNFADPTTLGKIGTDIRDRKCSWLVIQAMRLCNEEQMADLRENYGRNDDACEKRVKELYDYLGLDRVYSVYEEAAMKEINGLIDNVDEGDGLTKTVFTAFLDKIYGRSK